MDTRQTEIKALQQYMQKSKEELQKLEQQLKEQKVCWMGRHHGSWLNNDHDFGFSLESSKLSLLQTLITQHVALHLVFEWLF